ncbi:ROK family protein [Clostridium intestinale]|uniref:ROK family protein n=1 Tax=Clostridium intestinale TaxID=36845 RepID=A0A7D7AE28_9CLOT|nr:ROK family protein [Clostridium intestinale]QLY80244.1 ROK family protein [Clostridium intestinale]
MKNYVVGVDLGGTKISCALSDLEGRVVAQTTIPTLAHEGDNPVLGRIIKTIEMVLEEGNVETNEVAAIGIGSPGPLDAKNGIIVTTPNLPFKNFQLVKPIEEKFSIPTYLDNDANVAAIAEFMFGAGKGTENMVYITVSTGVGGGAILNGKIYRGSTTNALEVGHTTVFPGGPRCGCGNLGCLEATSSGTAIGRRANEAVNSKVETSLRDYETVTSYEVFKEAEKGDAVSKKILDEAFNYLGIGVANIIASFDPDKVIIGGGVSKGGDVLFNKVQEVVNERCFKSMAEYCKIVPAGLGTDAGVLGAVALAIMESK